MIGFFGKIPAHGDFISREIDSNFVSLWDDWLQKVIAESKNILGDKWLDNYLISPVWRFVIQAGVIDQTNWGGILLPSVDSVGRYFPLTVVFEVEECHSNCFYLEANNKYYQAVESKCREALDECLDANTLLMNLQNLSFEDKTELVDEFSAGLGAHTNGINDPYYALMSRLLEKRYSNYISWLSSGVENRYLITAGELPNQFEFVEMLEYKYEV